MLGLRKIAYEFLWLTRRALRRPMSDRFQPYSYSLPDRYPLVFRFAADELGDGENLRLLSFGCSRGQEVASLRRYFPRAHIKGLDIDRRNIAICRRLNLKNVKFAVASSTEAERAEAYDAVFCLAVLCHGDLRISETPPSNCARLIKFADFDKTVSSFSRCLKIGGLLFVNASNFRFADASVASNFNVVLRAENPDGGPYYDRTNSLLIDTRYHEIGFRKHTNA